MISCLNVLPPGAGPWHRGRSSDTDTEREFGSRSRTRSERVHMNGRSHSPNAAEDVARSAAALEGSLDSAPPISYWSAKRHSSCGNPTPAPPWSAKPISWRHTSSLPTKLKTANAALVLCLNIDVDPPDVVKTSPCAVLECWVDPRSMPSIKALEHIGANLKSQFENLSQKIQYKPILDPSFEDLRKACQQLRKQAKDDAVLFHYNGHGVPKPTSSGELWCFNRTYTQYLPVSLQEIQNWLGSPGVYIWDCSAAGHLLHNFNEFAKRRDEDIKRKHGGQFPEGMLPFAQSLQLAACEAHETLPTCPDLPADMFTSCLTSPIDIAIRHHMLTNKIDLNIDGAAHMPGNLKDRRTPLGELNWIFTAITDTIAWTTFTPEMFARLYRSDLLIASLFRNFLLAERLMKGYNCTPHTSPPLPSTNTHPLWATWDLALDSCIRQLPDLLAANEAQQNYDGQKSPPYQYVPNSFFADQLTAFEVWISRGGSALTRRGPLSLPSGTEYEVALTAAQTTPLSPNLAASWSSTPHLVPRKPPTQLPIVLQVLLSQPHRLRALILLSQFVDLGPWAVNLVLTVGIFPYISKLLQAPGPDLRPVLIFIWARILAVDPSIQVDLYNNAQGYKYFSKILTIHPSTSGRDVVHTLPNTSEHLAMCTFILASLARDFSKGQQACWEENVFDACFNLLDEADFLLRQWSCLCIAQMWCGSEQGKMLGVTRGTQDKLVNLMSDDSAEVRCAALYALGTFMGSSGSKVETEGTKGGGGSGGMYDRDERTHFRMEVAVVTGATLVVREDASPMCRKELVVLVSCLVKEWRGYFVVCAWIYWEEERKRRHATVYPYVSANADEVSEQAVREWLDSIPDAGLREESRVLLSSFYTIFVVLLDLSVDPYSEVATQAQTVVDYIMALLLESPFTKLDEASLGSPPLAPINYINPNYPDARPENRDARSRISSGSQQSSPSLSYPAHPIIAPPSPSASSIRSDAPPVRPSLSRADTMTSTISNTVTSTVKRTSSIANALKNLAGGINFPPMEDTRTASPTPSVYNFHLNGTSHHLNGDVLEQVEASRPPSPTFNVAQYASPYSRPVTPTQIDAAYSPYPSSSSRSPSLQEFAQQVHDFRPSDVMEALMEEDMERLRARKRLKRGMNGYTQQYHNNGYGTVPSPSNSTFSVDSAGSSVILGLGTGMGIRDVLPLKSTFFDWCSEYFTEPQMRQAEADEPGSTQYNYQIWRQQRNEQVDNETRSQAEVASDRRWDRTVAYFHGLPHPLNLAFHSYDQHLVASNDTDIITVWDWTRNKRLRSFRNGNPKGTSITSLHIINQNVGGIITTGSADGVVRLYRNYDPLLDPGPVQMVSSFRGLNEIVPMRHGSGVVMDWKQSAGILLVGGDSKAIKTWDAQTEIQGLDMDTASDAPVTSIASDPGSSQIFVAGFGDGWIKVFDRRFEEDEAIVQTHRGHNAWVQNVKPHPTMIYQFLSASVEGEVKLWDLRGRSDQAVTTWNLMQDVGLSAFDVHATAEVVAGSSAITNNRYRSQRLCFQSLAPGHNEPLSQYNVASGLITAPIKINPSPYIPRSTSFVFHPTEMLCGVGEGDGTSEYPFCSLFIKSVQVVFLYFQFGLSVAILLEIGTLSL
ncbi:hypothetical protein F5876DRAFT_34250 [Lentinula aff. lateritia]|uniref:Uncharacterized protein n=1 Tax=Lentinula aff. lateritia TaxID=2804960 RepID=A0ACC1U9W3_9AGAR|nr:hypothetical protein F5876DRAFT_34250 [Lentinula aff. lateritia]